MVKWRVKLTGFPISPEKSAENLKEGREEGKVIEITENRNSIYSENNIMRCK